MTKTQITQLSYEIIVARSKYIKNLVLACWKVFMKRVWHMN